MLDPAAMDGNNPDTVRLPATAQAIAVAVAAAHRFGADHMLGDDAEAKLAIVVEELVTNLVEHGDAPGAPIDLAITLHGDHVAVALSDRGTPFDPRNAVASDGPPERGGGAGIMLVLAWSVVESYETHHGINRLVLSLPLAGASGR